jgi:hypothetical protein
MLGSVPFFVKILKRYTPLNILRAVMTLGVLAVILFGCKQMTGTAPTEPPPPQSNITTGMFTYHNDNQRTGRNLTETTLTRALVSDPTQFGKIGALKVEGQVYAQPLVANGVILPGQTDPKNLLYVATEQGNVYAFDITSGPNPSPVWQQNVIGLGCAQGTTCSTPDAVKRMKTAQGMKGSIETAAAVKAAKEMTAAAEGVPVTPVQVNAPNISPDISITATPVIDPKSQTIFLTAMSFENNAYVWKLHALKLATGEEQTGSPVVITETYGNSGGIPASIGNGSVNGVITFSPINELSRAGLLLNTNPITQESYLTIAFSSFNDNEPDHGWVFNYNPTTLQVAGVWMTTPNTGDGNIWGAAPAIDDVDQTIIFSTGNGGPQYANDTDFADSVVKLKMNGPAYSNPQTAFPYLPFDYFTPYNHPALATGDVDLGSGGLLVIPHDEDGVITSKYDLAVAGGKFGTVYLLNRGNLGQVSATQEAELTHVPFEIIGVLPGGTNYGPGIYGTPSYYNGKVYIGASGDSLRSIPIANSEFNLAAMQVVPKTTYPIPLRGVTATISASGPATQDAIVWYVNTYNYQYLFKPGILPPSTRDGTAVLMAFSTDDLSKPLFASPDAQVASLAANQNLDDCVDLAPNAAGCAVKYVAPTVQNGMVFVGTDTEVSVYGKLPDPNQSAQVRPSKTKKTTNL